MKCHVCKIFFLFVDISSYPTLFSSGDPLKDLCDQLLLSGVDDMRHTFSKIIGEAALKLEEACAQGATPKGLRIIVDAIGRYVVIEFDAGNDDLEEVIVRLAFEVSIIYLFSFEGGSFNTVFLVSGSCRGHQHSRRARARRALGRALGRVLLQQDSARAPSLLPGPHLLQQVPDVLCGPSRGSIPLVFEPEHRVFCGQQMPLHLHWQWPEVVS